MLVLPDVHILIVFLLECILFYKIKKFTSQKPLEFQLNLLLKRNFEIKGKKFQESFLLENFKTKNNLKYNPIKLVFGFLKYEVYELIEKGINNKEEIKKNLEKEYLHLSRFIDELNISKFIENYRSITIAYDLKFKQNLSDININYLELTKMIFNISVLVLSGIFFLMYNDKITINTNNFLDSSNTIFIPVAIVLLNLLLILFSRCVNIFNIYFFNILSNDTTTKKIIQSSIINDISPTISYFIIVNFCVSFCLGFIYIFSEESVVYMFLDLYIFITFIFLLIIYLLIKKKPTLFNYYR
jgi:hypothetical protein